MLNEAQAQIRDVARQFAERELAPGAAERDRTGKFPIDILKRMGPLGLLGVMVDPAYDGAGADHVAYANVIAELAAGDGGFATIVHLHNGLICKGVEIHGSAEQKDTYLGALARGEQIGCFCLTEPETGSDAAAIRTSARRRGNHFVLDGTKQFVSAGSIADLAIVFAVSDPSAGKRGVSAFLVPTRTPGFNVVRTEHKMGQRGAPTCQVVLDNCEVPASAMLGEEGAGLRIAFSGLEGGRIAVAAQALGMARAAYGHALAYARERKAFGKPIIEHQALAFRLADMATGLQAAELMIWRAASLRDQGVPCLKEASMAKLFSTETAEKICHDAIQIFGGNGYMQDYPVERIYRDLRVCSIYEGTSDVQRMLISRQIAAGH